MWEGRTVAILASGPSMSQAVADRVRGLTTVVINDTYRLAPWADMLYAADGPWWEVHQEALSFDGLKVTASPCKYHDLLLLETSGPEGFDPNPKRVKTGGNSGYQAVHIAIHAKAKRILLCGFDMHNKDGHHWFGKHPKPLRNPDSEVLLGRAQRFRGLVDRGSEVLNCTPGSAISCFPRMTLEAALGAL